MTPLSLLQEMAWALGKGDHPFFPNAWNFRKRGRSPFLFAYFFFAASLTQASEISVVMLGGPPKSIQSYQVGSSFFLSATEMASLYGAQTHWRPVSRLVSLSLHGHVVEFQADSREAFVEGKPVALDSPVLWRASQAWVPISFFASQYFLAWSGLSASFNPRTSILSIVAPGSLLRPARKTMPANQARATASYGSITVKRLRIVIDPGHGGKDPGARGLRGTLEKDVNLEAGLELARLLKGAGVFDVKMTRQDDTFVPLETRSKIANAWHADLFVSLHSNASKNPQDSGFETYFLSEKSSDPQSQRLAEFENSSLSLEAKFRQHAEVQLLLGELSKTEYVNASSEFAGLVSRQVSGQTSLSDRGVKQAGFYVLRGTHSPAILFEMGYLTNGKDEKDLRTESFRERLLRGLYAGILDYAKKNQSPTK